MLENHTLLVFCSKILTFETVTETTIRIGVESQELRCTHHVERKHPYLSIDIFIALCQGGPDGDSGGVTGIDRACVKVEGCAHARSLGGSHPSILSFDASAMMEPGRVRAPDQREQAGGGTGWDG